jgi:uncharacterized protein (TIGR02284 family)
MSDKIISLLNDLVETSKDGEEGFRAAAEDTKSRALQAILMRRAEDCRRGAVDLQQLIVQLGGKPEKSGSITGAMHRSWVNLRARVSGRPDLAILAECARGEDVAKGRYREALYQELPAAIRLVVQRQYYGVVQNHDQIRDLRDRYRAAA